VRFVAAVSAVTALLAVSCAAPVPRTRSLGALEANAILRRHTQPSPETSTRAYRALAASTLATHCRMFPTDSQLYDERAHTCGSASAAVLGIARLMLEVEARAQFLPPLIADGRVRWLDLPAGRACGP
jgi:hypothetical protein